MVRFWSFALVFFVSAGAAIANDTQPTISVTAEGRVAARPDMAIISMGVTQEARTARQAVDANSEAMRAIFERLEALEVEDRDIQTSNLNVSPIWDQFNSGSGPRRIVGFTATNLLTVRIRDLDALGGVLDQVLDDGANTFNSLRFALQNLGPLRDEARVKAVEEARRKATLYAEAAGVTLGPVLSLTEFGGGAPQPIARMEAAFASDAVPVASGELNVSASVSMVFKIAE